MTFSIRKDKNGKCNKYSACENWKSNWLYSSDFLYNIIIIDTAVVLVLLSNSSLYQRASCQIEIVFLTVLLDLCSSIKSRSLAAVCNDFTVFVFSSFLWSSQIVSHIQTKLKGGPLSPGLEFFCISRRKFANLDLLRIHHFEKFNFRSDTHRTGLILGKYQTGNHTIWLVDFPYQTSQKLSRVINNHTIYLPMPECIIHHIFHNMHHLSCIDSIQVIRWEYFDYKNSYETSQTSAAYEWRHIFSCLYVVESFKQVFAIILIERRLCSSSKISFLLCMNIVNECSNVQHVQGCVAWCGVWESHVHMSGAQTICNHVLLFCTSTKMIHQQQLANFTKVIAMQNQSWKP